jgi:hAT family C-terminal dimerisation region
LIGGTNGLAFNHQQCTEVCDFFGDDLDTPMLKLQWTMSMKELFKDTKCSTVEEVVAVVEAKKGCINVLGEVDKLVHLFLIIPGSSATAQRSFSTTRRLKTYLRTTMTAARHSSVVLLHTQRHYTDELLPENIVTEFVDSNAPRNMTLG